MTRLNPQNLIHSNAPARAVPDCKKSVAAIGDEIAHVRRCLLHHNDMAQRGGGWSAVHSAKAKDCRKQIAALQNVAQQHQNPVVCHLASVTDVE